MDNDISQYFQWLFLFISRKTRYTKYRVGSGSQPVVPDRKFSYITNIGLYPVLALH